MVSERHACIERTLRARADANSDSFAAARGRVRWEGQVSAQRARVLGRAHALELRRSHPRMSRVPDAANRKSAYPSSGAATTIR